MKGVFLGVETDTGRASWEETFRAPTEGGYYLGVVVCAIVIFVHVLLLLFVLNLNLRKSY